MMFQFVTDCVSSTCELITDMVDSSREITYKTFFKYVSLSEVANMLGYETDPRKGLTIKNDWHVGYYKSVYRGKPCYYVRWSGIEYVFCR